MDGKRQRFATLEQIEAMFGVNIRSLRRLVKIGALTSYRPVDRTMLCPDEVEAYFRSTANVPSRRGRKSGAAVEQQLAAA